MPDRPEWFAPKRFGYSAGLPIAWQGWAVLAAYLALVAASARLVDERPAALVGTVVPASAALVLIAAETTRGGFRWRWGGRRKD